MKKQAFEKKHRFHSKLQMEKLRKKMVAGEEEKLDVLGQESEKKAKKWIIEEGKKTEKKEKEIEDAWQDVLHASRKKKNTYYKKLMFRLYSMIEEIEWPKVYEYGVWFDGKGILLAVKDKFGKLWKKAFIPSFDPKFDLNACFRFAVWAEDVLDMVEGRLVTPQSKGGVWLP